MPSRAERPVARPLGPAVRQTRLKPLVLALFLFTLGGAGRAALAAEVLEHRPDGSLLAKRQMDEAGRPHGLSLEYHPDGTLRAEKRYDHGLLDGVSRLYYPSGALQTEWRYKAGRREGKGVGYYENGVLKDEGFYKADKLEGVSRLYASDGSLKAELNFKNDLLEGKSTTYFPGGGVQYIYTYRKGRIVRSQTFGPGGALIMEQDYPLTQVQP